MSKECYYMRNKKHLSSKKYSLYFKLKHTKCKKRLKKKATDRLESEHDLTYYEILED